MNRIRTKECEVTWKGGSGPGVPPYKTKIPAGLRVRPCKDASGQFFLDDFPLDLFPRGSFERHDATHYGVRLNVDQVETYNPAPVGAVRVRCESYGVHRIDEIVTQEGGYITWTDCFGTYQSAIEYLLKMGYREEKNGNYQK